MNKPMNKPKKNSNLQEYFKDFKIRQFMEIINVIVFCIIIHFVYMGLSTIDSIKTPLSYHAMQDIPDNSNLMGYHLSNWATIKYKDIIYYQSPFFHPKKVAERRILGRVIGLPGDIIEIKSGEVYRNNHKISEEYLEKSRFSDSYAPIIVPRNQVYVLVDNRGLSIRNKSIQEWDSRQFGLIMGDLIDGIK